MATTNSTQKKRGRPSKSAQQKKIEQERELKKKQERHVVKSALLLIFGILVIALAFIKGESVWTIVHDALFGVFGKMTYFLGFVLLGMALMYAYKKRATDLERWSALLLFVVIGISIYVFGTNFLSNMSFVASIKQLYAMGVDHKGAGALFGSIGWLLVKIIGAAGSRVIFILAIIALLFMLTGKTMVDLFASMRKQHEEDTKDFEPLQITIPKVEIRRERKPQDIDISLKDMEKKDIDIAMTEREERRTAAKEKAAQKQAFGEPMDMNVKFVSRKARQVTRTQEQKKNIDVELGPWGKEGQREKIEEQPFQVELGPAATVADEVFGIRETAEQQDKDIFAHFGRENDTATEKPVSKDRQVYRFGQEEALPETVRTKKEEPDEPLYKVATDDIMIKRTDSKAMPEGVKSSLTVPETKPSGKPFKPAPLNILSLSNDENTLFQQAELKSNGEFLVETLKSFGVKTKIVGISQGPTVTRYDLQPEVGVRLSKITNLADDIAMNLAASAGVRIVAPIPNKAAVGIEVPNKTRNTVALRNVLESKEFKRSESVLSVGLGKDISGENIVADIAEMPHLLIAGTTGSGKSICLHTMLISMIYKSTPDELRLILIDPKMVEFGRYNGIPYLLIPVVTDPHKAAGALGWAVGEMLKRYKTFSNYGVRDLDAFNKLVEAGFAGTAWEESEDKPTEKLPRIVIVIDELSDLMMAAPNEVEDYICRLAQMARAAGLHLIIATQRPSVDVITGVIKANISSRIALSVSSQIDSRTIIDQGGAEKLLGRGDMLFFPGSFPKPVRVQGCYISDKEIDKVLDYIKKNNSTEYDQQISEEINRQAAKDDKGSGDSSQSSDSGGDSMLDAAIETVIESGAASTSLLQRKLKLGYSRAARIMDTMEEMGIITPQDGSKPRKVLWTMTQWQEYQLMRDDETAGSGDDYE